MSKPTEIADIKGIRSVTGWRDIDRYQSLPSGPFRHSVTVGWGDCDPAQIAYTARIPEWGLLAIEQWYRQCIGADWYVLNLHYGIGTPFVSLDFQFRSSIRPGSSLEIDVLVGKLGNSSLRHTVKGYQQDKLCFEGSTAAIFVEAASMRPLHVPPNIRGAIEAFISQQN